MSQQIIKIDETKDGENEQSHKIINTTHVVSPSDDEETQEYYEAKKAIFRASQVVWFIVGIIEVLLGFRILLKLIGASPASAFTQTIYSFSDPFALPFSGIVRATVSGFSVLEWSSIIAMGVYAVVAWGIIELFQVVKPIEQQDIKHAT